MNPLSPKEEILIKNVSGNPIPPFSLVVVTSVEFTTEEDTQEVEMIHHADRYDGTKNGNWFITGCEYILSNEYGSAYSDRFIYAAVDTGLTAPRTGEQWGPCPNQFYLTRGMPGFICQGAPQDSTTPTLFLRTDDLEVEGRLTSSLSAPASNNTASATATMKIYFGDPSSATNPVAVIASSLSDITVCNRDHSMTGSSGYFCRAKMAHNGPKIEWKITALGCST